MVCCFASHPTRLSPMKEELFALFSFLFLLNAGQYDFEQAALEKTNCFIFTFDWYVHSILDWYSFGWCSNASFTLPLFTFTCSTFKGKNLHKRHRYHKQCIGSNEAARAKDDFITLSQALKATGFSHISLLKIDIEGFEFDEMAQWSQFDITLPEQIAIEVHHSQVIYAGTSFNNSQDFSNVLCTTNCHVSVCTCGVSYQITITINVYICTMQGQCRIWGFRIWHFFLGILLGWDMALPLGKTMDMATAVQNSCFSKWLIGWQATSLDEMGMCIK